MIINERMTSLSLKNARILATWVYKTAMVFDLMRKDPNTRYFLPRERARIISVPIREILPEHGLYIWLARCLIDSPWTAIPSSGRYSLKHESEKPFDFFTFNLSIGRIAFQIFAFRDMGIIEKYISSIPFNGATVKLWPPTKGTIRPPARILNTHDFQCFQQRWQF